MDYTQARQMMIAGQILPHKVFPGPLIECMESLPRENFVPSELTHLAYADEILESLPNRYLFSPMVFARLVQEAQIHSLCHVLDIGFGTGYSSLVFSRLARQVTSLESDSMSVQKFKALLPAYHAENISVVCGPLQEGWKAQAPYDVIFIEGAVQQIPSVFQGQLKEGGRVVAIQEGAALKKASQACIFNKDSGCTGWRKTFLFEAHAPSLPEFVLPEGFSL